MNKLFYHTKYIVISLLFACLFSSNAHAFLIDIFHTDLGKVGNKISAIVQDTKMFYERTVEQIRGSQFVMLIGKGKEKAQEAKEWVKKVQDLKDDVLNSVEYKIALKTKEVASATKELNGLNNEKKSKVKEIRDNELLEVSIWEEKIALAKSNKQIGEELYETSKTKSEDEENSKDEISDDVTDKEYNEENELTEEAESEFSDAMDAEIKSYEEKIEEIHLLADNDVAETEDDYENRIKDQSMVVKELGEELAALIKENKDKFKKERIKAAKKDLVALVASAGAIFMFKAGEEKTVSDVERKRKAASKEFAKSSIAAINNAAASVSASSDNKYAVENVELTQDAHSGKSEVIDFSIEQTIKQAEEVSKYLRSELDDLKVQINMELRNRGSEATEGEVVDIDICDYESKQVADYGEEKGKKSNSANTDTGME